MGTGLMDEIHAELNEEADAKAAERELLAKYNAYLAEVHSVVSSTLRQCELPFTREDGIYYLSVPGIECQFLIEYEEDAATDDGPDIRANQLQIMCGATLKRLEIHHWNADRYRQHLCEELKALIKERLRAQQEEA